jgi:rhodanese-related sulfurtransferase
MVREFSLSEALMKRVHMLVLAVLGLLATICVQAAAPISNGELLKRINAGDAPLVLDVRSNQEYGGGHVPGAQNIPVDQLADRLGELRGRHEAEIVVYCESGRRAARARELLDSEGFINVRHLTGDMRQWRRDGLRTER